MLPSLLYAIYCNCSIYDFLLPVCFLSLKPSFVDDHFTTQRSDFCSFLIISLTDKPVDRGIHGCAFTWQSVFALPFTIFTKKQGRSSSNSDSGYKIQKNICGGKIYSHTRTTRIEYSSRKKHEILMRLKLQRLLFNLFVYQVQSYCFLVDVFTLGSSFFFSS